MQRPESSTTETSEPILLTDAKNAFSFAVYLDPEQKQDLHLDLGRAEGQGEHVKRFVALWEDGVRSRWSNARRYRSASVFREVGSVRELEAGVPYVSAVFGGKAGSVYHVCFLRVMLHRTTADVSLYNLTHVPSVAAYAWRWYKFLLPTAYLLLIVYSNGNVASATGAVIAVSIMYVPALLLLGVFGLEWLLHTRHAPTLERLGNMDSISQAALAETLQRIKSEEPLEPVSTFRFEIE